MLPSGSEGCDDALRTFKAALRYEALDLTRVGLIFYAVFAPADYSVKDAAFLSIRRAGPQSGLYRDFVLVRYGLFHPVEGSSRATRREIIPMYRCHDPPLCVPEQIGAGVTLGEA